ncbi:MAG TPA: Fe-Mn family superoxide dismutase [Candidatus Methylomirabilis sp.]|nr:Fe-Mn family superoxide dismutase [Candidatus Methylomirabilis sp.]
MVQSKRRAYTEQRFEHLKGLDGISDDQIKEHLLLYAGYVAQVNALNDELAELRERGRASGKDHEFAELTRRLGFEYNGMILHEYYFSNLKPAVEVKPTPNSKIAIGLRESFGSVEQWRTDFHAIAGMRGIGWVLLCQDPVTDRLTNHWVTLHQDGVPASFKPLLVVDVWEHAFMRDYKATERGRYLDAFFRNIDWRTVEQRLEKPMAIRPAAAA